jgi:uncharacterized membrane protein
VPPPSTRRARRSFAQDFRRFFVRGLGTLLPTILTVSVIWWVADFLWESIGWYLIEVVKQAWAVGVRQGWADPTSTGEIRRFFDEAWWTKPLGIGLALVLIYLVGLLVGNFLGRALYAAAERIVLRVPVVRAVYPAVKQVTDFLLADKQQSFEGSRVVACRVHNNDIWSIAFVTGPGLKTLDEQGRGGTVTLFVPSSPTAFSGYMMVAPREEVVELPMTTEEAMRLLISGGVIGPAGKAKDANLPTATVDKPAA